MKILYCKLMNWLFGWDYISIKYAERSDFTRIVIFPDGVARVKFAEIICPLEVVVTMKDRFPAFVTCKPEKYFP